VITDKQQEAYDLHLQGLTQQEIADQLGICQSAVSHRLNGAYRWLKGERRPRRRHRPRINPVDPATIDGLDVVGVV